MGLKVNIFLTYCLFHGVLLSSFNVKALGLILLGFTLLYKNFKVWKFTGRFPGKNLVPNFNNLFANSTESFHSDLKKLWIQHGRDKFVTWIGFERYVAVSKFDDIQVRNDNYLLLTKKMFGSTET
jgi:hypothetical protein